MNTCVVYFSRTGNTKRLAQAIAEAAKAPIFNIAETLPSAIETYDLIILGTPVEGSNPAKETKAFIESMSKREGKKAILFCTYRIFGNNRTMKTIDKALSTKGYITIASFSKKGMKQDQEADFTEILSEVKKTLEKL
jgi:flavodoxin